MELPSGFMNTLTSQQEVELAKLQEKVKDVPFLKDHPDREAYLLRFLRATMDKKKTARIFHTENTGKRKRAYARLIEAAKFYEKWGLENPPAAYSKFDQHRPYKMWFDERAMKVVICEKVALLYVNQSPSDFTIEEWTACIGYRVHIFEEFVSQCRKEHKLDDRPLIVVVQDVQGLSLRARHMISIFTLYNSILGDHYPENLARGYVINAPWVFHAVYQIAKKIVDATTLEKIVVADTSALVQVLDKAELPEEYGGEGSNVPVPPKTRK